MSEARDLPTPHLPDDEDTQVRTLLPFYVNDSLSRADRARVDAWLSRSSEHTAEAAWFSQLAEAVRSQANAANPEAGLAHLRRRIQADRTTGGLSKSLLQRVLASLGPLLTPPMAIAYGLVLAQAVVIAVYASRETTEHELMRTTSDAAVMLPGPYARVIFSPRADEAGIRNLLLRNQLQIVGGPNTLGEYWLARTNPESVSEAAWLPAIEREALVESAVIDDKTPTSRH